MPNLALVYESPKTQTLRELPIHEPIPGYIQVRVEAAAVNPADQKIFDWDRIKTFPTVLGCDAAGEVTKVPADGNSRFKVGDRISFMCLPGITVDGGVSYTPRGAFQQYALADEKFALKIPDGIDYADGSTWMGAGISAASAVYTHLKIKEPWLGGKDAYKGQKIVILGGSSSVGSYAIQLAALAGFDIITTASAAHLDYVKSLGASTAIDRSAPNVAEQILAAAGGPVQYAIDPVSFAATQSLAVEVLQENGILNVMLPLDASVQPALDAKKIQLRWGYGIAGMYPNPELHTSAEEYFKEGLLKFNRPTVLGGLEAWEEAFEMHRKGAVSGTKLVMLPQKTQQK
ncbi:GroES-like protein [Mycena chlorophos]|uniref:GroES-like protein n=1 Tax=Mycena chlorophos TaxID=658473 RepID=A0A8H6WKY1_MYCCL|nr:GroES-like protein [Mycena chlorophos]